MRFNFSDIKENHYDWSILIMAFFVPFTVRYFNIGLVVLSLSFIMYSFQHGFQFKSILKPISISFISIFLLEAISILYSENQKIGLKNLESHLLFVGFPILLSNIKTLDNKRLKNILFSFILGTVAFLSYTFIVALYDFIFDKFTENTSLLHKFDNHFTYQKFTQKTGHHAVYFTSFLIFSTFALFETRNLFTNKRIFYSLLIFFIVYIFLLKSAMLIFIFAFLLFIYLLSKINFSIIFFVIITSILATLTTIIILYKSNFFIKHNFIESYPYLISGCLLGLVFGFIYKQTIKNDIIKRSIYIFTCLSIIFFSSVFLFEIFEQYSLNHESNLTYRYWNWKAGIEIINHNLFFGTGIGDVSKDIIKIYERINFEAGLYYKFNEHNQFIRFWMEIGVIGFILFAIIQFLLISTSIKSHFSFVVFAILFFGFSITESTLCRHFGVSFFVFYSILFEKYKFSEK